MKGILTRFLLEHDRSKTHLNFLNDAVNRVIRDGYNSEDFDILKNSQKYFEAEVGEHCKREEVNVYPGLSKIVSAIDIYELKYEHEKVDESLVRLKLILRQFEQLGSSDDLLVRLKVDAKYFITLLSSHISKEDGYFYIMARENLSEKELNHIFRTRKEKL